MESLDPFYILFFSFQSKNSSNLSKKLTLDGIDVGSANQKEVAKKLRKEIKDENKKIKEISKPRAIYRLKKNFLLK